MLLGPLLATDAMRAAREGANGLDVESSMFPELRDRTPEHEWILRNGKHWQIASASFEDPVLTDTEEGNRGSCPVGMAEIRGHMKRDLSPYSLEAMQSIMCTDWMSRSFPERCGVFDEGKWDAFIEGVPTSNVAFCIDRFEYPNVKGQYPWVLVTWIEATRLCGDEGKRLCSEDEWTFACEGEDAWPYPYGFIRSSATCVIDRPWRNYDDRAWADRAGRFAMLEIDRLWQGEASGSRPTCRSPFGVYDMTGNVDEWTQSVETQGYRSVMKGGYWGEVRDRCRASTRAHGESFAFYQQGFRCCADVPASPQIQVK
ncbi:MAG TPA: SUMF1/EgtB/PvdO family nonheme iron enzyme [Polyangiaceae bacterium]